MSYLRVLHNGDLRKDTPIPSPHWMVHVRQDGSAWGEILMRGWSHHLPEGFRMSEHERFFDIPPEFSSHKLTAQPYHEEIIVSLEPHCVCSFVMSQLPAGCRLHRALADLVQKIQELVDEQQIKYVSRPAA